MHVEASCVFFLRCIWKWTQSWGSVQPKGTTKHLGLKSETGRYARSGLCWWKRNRELSKRTSIMLAHISSLLDLRSRGAYRINEQQLGENSVKRKRGGGGKDTTAGRKSQNTKLVRRDSDDASWESCEFVDIHQVRVGCDFFDISQDTYSMCWILRWRVDHKTTQVLVFHNCESWHFVGQRCPFQETSFERFVVLLAQVAFLQILAGHFCFETTKGPKVALWENHLNSSPICVNFALNIGQRPDAWNSSKLKGNINTLIFCLSPSPVSQLKRIVSLSCTCECPLGVSVGSQFLVFVPSGAVIECRHMLRGVFILDTRSHPCVQWRFGFLQTMGIFQLPKCAGVPPVFCTHSFVPRMNSHPVFTSEPAWLAQETFSCNWHSF